MIKKSVEDYLAQINPMQVLDFCTQPVFFLNERYELIYRNQAAAAFFEKNQHHFKEIDPHYSSDLLGKQFDAMQKVLQHLAVPICSLKMGEALTKKVIIDVLHLECRITPIFSLQNQRLASCFEIQDRTVLVRTLCVLEDAIYTAENGSFDKKLSLELINEENQDFLLISQKINILFEKIQGFFGEIVCVLDDLMHGKMTVLPPPPPFILP